MDERTLVDRGSGRKVLVVHTVTGPLRIPLSGNERIDELLRAWAARGGAVVREEAA